MFFTLFNAKIHALFPSATDHNNIKLLFITINIKKTLYN